MLVWLAGAVADLAAQDVPAHMALKIEVVQQQLSGEPSSTATPYGIAPGSWFLSYQRAVVHGPCGSLSFTQNSSAYSPAAVCGYIRRCAVGNGNSWRGQA